ncbi:MAG: hypothetical protein M1837_005258 [Sclerophora amabilis]|nr:MAG: hypothetical protein M1837_005258 [Sclerophora amabilis]
MSSPCSPMPGSFILDRHGLDQALPPKLDINVGAKSHNFFQPPGTPSASSSLHRSTSGFNTDRRAGSAGASRKRPRRADSPHDFVTPGSTMEGSWSFNPAFSDTSANLSAGFVSPAPFVNTRYRLSGGIDTPTAAANMLYEQDQDSANVVDESFRRNWNNGMAKRPYAGDDYGYSETPGALARERNGRPRTTLTPSGPSRKGWSKAVFTVVGGVAGKVWQFCRENAFGGFYAGGGPGYRMTALQNAGEESVWQDDEGSAKKPVLDFSRQKEGTPIPGQFPESEPYDYTRNESLSPRPSKRIQRDKGEGDLRGHWVMVSSATTPQLRELSPSRKNASRKSTGSASGRQQSTPSRRAGPTRPGKRASVAPSRAPQVSYTGSPAVRGGQVASYASTRSPSLSPGKKTKSPVPVVDPQKFAAQRRREEKQANANMAKFNDQLKAMIKEGKEALGSTVEIEDDDDGMNLEDVQDGGLEAGVNVAYAPGTRLW